MSKKNEDTALLHPSDDANALVVPDFLRTAPKEGLDDLSKYQTTPRLAIVQGQSSPDRKEAFGEGGVAVMPDGAKVAAKGEEFIAIPLVFWPTWEVWSDINNTQSQMVTEITQDETSEIARRCKSPDLRDERYGDRNEFVRKYVECLNFIIRIETGPSAGSVAIVTFNGGEHYTGAKLCGLLKRRPVSIFANRIAFKSAIRARNNRSWYGLNFNNPADGKATIQTQEEYAELQQMHRELAAMVGAESIKISREDPAPATAEVSDEEIPF